MGAAIKSWICSASSAPARCCSQPHNHRERESERERETHMLNYQTLTEDQGMIASACRCSQPLACFLFFLPLLPPLPLLPRGAELVGSYRLHLPLLAPYSLDSATLLGRRMSALNRISLWCRHNYNELDLDKLDHDNHQLKCVTRPKLSGARGSAWSLWLGEELALN